MKRICCAVILLALAAFPLGTSFAAVPQAVTVNKIAAVVNGEMITLHSLRQHASPEIARAGLNPNDPAARRQIDMIMSKVLTVMIEDMLLRQEAGRLQIKVADNEVDNEMRKLAQRNQMTLKEFEARLVAQGGTMAMLREKVRNNILSQRIINIMIARKTVVTAEDIKNYYEANKNEFEAERSVDISLIVFSPSSDPLDVYSRIKKGAISFEEAATKFSEGPAPENGGHLGMIKWDDLAAPLRAQIIQLKKGDISEIFQINSRDCLLKLNNSLSGRSMTLEEASPEIEKLLREPMLQDRFTEYTQQLRSRAVIDIRL